MVKARERNLRADLLMRLLRRSRGKGFRCVSRSGLLAVYSKILTLFGGEVGRACLPPARLRIEKFSVAPIACYSSRDETYCRKSPTDAISYDGEQSRTARGTVVKACNAAVGASLTVRRCDPHFAESTCAIEWQLHTPASARTNSPHCLYYRTGKRTTRISLSSPTMSTWVWKVW